MNADNLLTGMIALELGLVTPDQLADCVKTQSGQLDPRPLGEILRARNFLTESQLKRLLSEQKRRFEEFSDARLFGQIALSKHFLTDQQLGECIREQLRMKSTDRPMIGQVMVRKGYLTLQQFAEVIAEQGSTLFHCSECERFHIQSRQTPLSKATCDRCGRMLRMIDESSVSGKSSGHGDTTVFFKGPLASLGKFHILGEIARGSMGIVFKAHDSSLDRTVALKVLKEGDADEAFIKRLQREGAIAAKLHHPNIVSVHEVGHIHGLHYLCMDYIAGLELLHSIRQSSLDRSQTLRLMETICKAVHYAHVQGIVHRDLKPSNILVTSDGVPVITDFGLAKSLDTMDMTKEGTSLGTPHYMPPEQVRGDVAKMDLRSDVYSLGAILYEILTGRPPFSARTTVDLYQKILTEEPERPSQVDASIDPDLEAIVLKALEKEREQRYFSAEDLALDLHRHLAGEPVMATRATRWRSFLRKARQHRLRIAVLAAVAVVAAIATLVVIDRGRARRVSKLEGEAHQFRSQRLWDPARQRYEQILALDPGNDRAQAGWKECVHEIAREQERQRREAEKRGHTTAGQERERRMAAARPHYEAGFRKFHDALTLLHLPDADPRDAEERYHDAVDDFTRAIDRAPDFADAYFLRAQCHLHLGSDRRGEEDLTEAIRLSPTHSAAYYERGKLRLLHSFTLSASTLMKSRIETFTSRSRRQDAAEDLRNAVYHAPNSPTKDEQFVLRAFLEIAEGQLYDAVVDFSRGIGANPANSDAHLGRGYAHLLGGEWALAIRHFGEAVRLRPNLHAAYFLRAVARVGAGDLEGARKEFESLAARFPSPAAQQYLALVHGSSGRWEDALRALDQGLAMDPENLDLRLARAGTLYNLRRHEEAIEECRAIFGRDPQSTAAHKIAAVCHYRKLDFESAFLHFKKALELDPRDDSILANYASLLHRTGKFNEAWETTDRVIALNPKNAEARLVRGVILLEKERLREAEAEFQAGLALDPGHATGHLHYGRLLAKLGRKKEAIAEFETFARLEPEGKDTADRLIAEMRTEGN